MNTPKELSKKIGVNEINKEKRNVAIKKHPSISELYLSRGIEVREGGETLLDSDALLLGVRSQCCYLLAVLPWTDSFFIHK